MHEVAEAASRAFAHLVLATAGFPEVGDGRQLAVDGETVVPTVVQIRHRLGCVFFLAEFDVHVAHLETEERKEVERKLEEREGEAGKTSEDAVEINRPKV